MGWLGWSEQIAMASDVNSIMLAMEGKIEMLYPEAIKKKPLNREQFNSKFKAFVAQHNANHAANKRK